jgi:competence protein ComEC
MLLPALFWVAGFLLVRYLFPQPGLYLGIAAVALLAGIFCKASRNVSILILFLAMGALRYTQEEKAPSALLSLLQERGRIRQNTEFIVQTRLSEGVYQIQLKKIAGLPVDEKLLLYSSEDLRLGTGYSALSDLRYLVKDPVLDVYPKRFEAILKPVLPLQELDQEAVKNPIQYVRDWANNRLDLSLGRYAPLAKALLLGDADFKRERRQDLSRAGITHLIVVSGLHVALLSLIIMVVLRFFLPLRIAELLFMLVLLFFAALNNWAPPILRAMLMIDLMIISRWLSRPLAAAQNLSVSLFIITLINPMELFQLGLQLSFLCVALIVFALPYGFRKNASNPLKRMLLALGHYMLVSLIVGLGIMPISLYYFGSASLNGIIGNLLGLPLIMLLLGLSILCLLFPFRAFVLSFQVLSDLWDMWLSLCARMPFALESYWISFSQVVTIGLLFLLFILVLKGRVWRYRYFVLPSLLMAFMLWNIPQRHKNELYIFNAGVADCSLIFADDGSSMMIDTGGISGIRAETDLQSNKSRPSWMQKKLLVWLARNKVKSLDYLLLTHMHSDHAGGLEDALKSLNVKHLILSEQDLNSQLFSDLRHRLELDGVKIISIQDTMRISLGKNSLKILHPGGNFPDPNNRSLVVKYYSPKATFLFTGDIEAEAEASLLKRYPSDLQADILKLAHHGSRGSSTPEFLMAVQAIEAVICSSESNIYGFPHTETLARLKRLNINTRYTYNGTLRYYTQ